MIKLKNLGIHYLQDCRIVKERLITNRVIKSVSSRMKKGQSKLSMFSYIMRNGDSNL
jgi:hypothetical protein